MLKISAGSTGTTTCRPPDDVAIEIAYAGICHSDVHTVRDEWGEANYLVLGHEITGRVTAVGSNVTAHQVGDRAGVGVMVDSWRTCAACEAGEENYRELGTYNVCDKFGEINRDRADRSG